MYKLTTSNSVIRLNDGAFIPADADNTDYQEFLKWSADPENEVLPADLPLEPPLLTVVVEAVQKRLDDFAKTRAYDGILSACTYATSKVPKFLEEGQYCVDARDLHWSTCYSILTAVQAGTRPMPTLEEVISEMPALIWPDEVPPPAPPAPAPEPPAPPPAPEPPAPAPAEPPAEDPPAEEPAP